MAGILNAVSWVFCLRPLTWFLEKIIKNKIVLGFLYEAIYLGLSILYFYLATTAFVYDDGGSFLPIVITIVGILGTLALGYGLMKYHKSDYEMSYTSHDGYEGTYNEYENKVYVKETTKESLTGDGFLAVLTAPLQILIRSLNFVLMFFCLFNRDLGCDLAYYGHPDCDGTLKTIFIDIFNLNRY